MVARPDKGIGLGQPARDALEFVEGVDLPGEVVEAHRGTSRARFRRGGADLEQPEFVVVGAARRLEEGAVSRPSMDVFLAHMRGARAWVLGPGARWACPVIGGLLLLGGLVGLLASGSH